MAVAEIAVAVGVALGGTGVSVAVGEPTVIVTWAVVLLDPQNAVSV